METGEDMQIWTERCGDCVAGPAIYRMISEGRRCTREETHTIGRVIVIPSHLDLQTMKRKGWCE